MLERKDGIDMSNFVEYLQGYMRDKQITPAELARETDIERTVVYRYVKGSRIPSEETTVIKIADALRMTVKEKQKLMEEYDRLIMGDLTVNSFQYVRQLLSELWNADLGQIRRNNSWKVTKIGEMDEQVLFLRSKEEIIACIIKIFEYAIGEENITIYLLMQPIYEMIQNFILPFFEGTQVKIEQIVCLEQNLSKSYENLKIFQKILPICFGNIKYEISYYYDYLPQHINNMSWMPNVMIVGDYVLQFNYGMTQGIVVKESSYVEGVLSQYRKYKEQTLPFFKKCQSVMDSYFIYVNYPNTTVRKCLFVEPCIGLCISSDIFQEYLHNFSQKNKLIQDMKKLVGDWKGKIYYPPGGLDLKITSYFKREGLLHFLKTGVVREFPEANYRPLGEEIRILVLERMIYLMKKGYVNYRLLMDEVEMPEDIYIYWHDETKSVCLNQMQTEEMSQVIVEESGIYRAFQCFLEYLDRKGMLMSEEETLGELEAIYEKVKKKQGECANS